MTTQATRDPLIVAGLTEDPYWLERVLKKISKTESGCWLWSGTTGGGYGKAPLPKRVTGGRTMLVGAHRVVWFGLRGAIEPTLVLDHDGASGCHNRLCVNPDHLEPVTMSVNSQRCEKARRTHCPQGHLLATGNLVAADLKKGHRKCLTCNRAQALELHYILRAAARHLGMTTKEYTGMYGKSRAKALAVMEDDE